MKPKFCHGRCVGARHASGRCRCPKCRGANHSINGGLPRGMKTKPFVQRYEASLTSRAGNLRWHIGLINRGKRLPNLAGLPEMVRRLEILKGKIDALRDMRKGDRPRQVAKSDTHRQTGRGAGHSARMRALPYSPRANHKRVR